MTRQEDIKEIAIFYLLVFATECMSPGWSLNIHHSFNAAVKVQEEIKPGLWKHTKCSGVNAPWHESGLFKVRKSNIGQGRELLLFTSLQDDSSV